MQPGFRWDDWNLDKMAKHGVWIDEAERVVTSARKPYPCRIDNDKSLVVGRGQGDRVIQVIYLVDPNKTIFIIHAMPLTTRRRRR